MGQRSQIYVRFDGQLIVANYYQWNYSERMISRARYGIDFIASSSDYKWFFLRDTNIEHLRRIFDVNFDMKDYQISQKLIDEWKEQFSSDPFNDVVFNWQGNNNGQLFINISKEGKISYAFRKIEDKFGQEPMSASEYMMWDRPNWQESETLTKAEKQTCSRNIKYIEKTARLMTPDELNEFLTHDYGYESSKEAD